MHSHIVRTFEMPFGKTI